jgi:hypothetical protein
MVPHRDVGKFAKGGKVMRKILGAASVAFAAAGCVVIGAAGQAAADPDLNGTYTLTVDQTQSTTTGFPLKDPKVVTTQWVITPCGAGCAHATVADRPNGGGDLHLVDGQWQLIQEGPHLDISMCPPGPSVTTVTSLDPATLQGTQVNTNHCLNNVITSPATLTPA